RALIARAAELLARAAPPERELPAFRPGHAKPPVRFWWQVRLPLAWAATVALALGIGTYLGERSGTRLARTVERPADLANRITQNVPALDSLAVAERQKVSERRARPSARSVTPAPAPAPSMHEGERKERRAEPPAAAIRIRGANRLNAGEVAPGFGDGGVVAKAAAPAPSRPEMVSLGERGYALKDAPIGVDSARLLLGRDPLAVPDLPIRGIYRARMIAYSGLVIVEQALDSTNVIAVITGRGSCRQLHGDRPGHAGWRIAVNAVKPAVVVIGPRGIVCVLERRTRPKVRTVVHIRRTGGARHAVRSRAAVVPCHGRARRDRERRRAERQTHHTHLRGGRRAAPAPASAPTAARR